MTGVEIGFLILGILTLVLSLVGAFAGMWRTFQKKVDDLHHRINETRDQYIRRDDVLLHLERIEHGQDRINQRLDVFLDHHAVQKTESQ